IDDSEGARDGMCRSVRSSFERRGARLSQQASGCPHDESAVRVDLERARAIDAHHDTPRVGARLQQQVVLEYLLLIVETNVHAVVHLAVEHAAETRHARSPRGWIVPAEEVVDGWLAIFTDEIGLRRCAFEG